MPQMASINWLSLYFIFIIVFILFINMNYFIFFFHQYLLKNQLLKNSVTWKW